MTTINTKFGIDDRVTIDGDGSIVGRILQIAWRGYEAEYEIAWFSNGVQQTAWFFERRLEIRR